MKPGLGGRGSQWRTGAATAHLRGDTLAAAPGKASPCWPRAGPRCRLALGVRNPSLPDVFKIGSGSGVGGTVSGTPSPNCNDAPRGAWPRATDSQVSWGSGHSVGGRGERTLGCSHTPELSVLCY